MPEISRGTVILAVLVVDLLLITMAVLKLL